MRAVPERRESGVALLEVLVAGALTLLVLAMGYGILSATTRTAAAVADRAHNSAAARQVIDVLDASLRFANGVWICAPITTTPQTATTATAPSCPAPSASGPAALLVSNDAAPTCTEWILSDGTLQEVGLGAPDSDGIAVTPVASYPGVSVASYGATTTATTTTTSASNASAGSAGSAGAGFALSLPGSTTTTPAVSIPGRLVQIDLSVNQDPTASISAADAVTVHDAIAPDNLTTSDDTTSVPCS